MEAVKSCSTFLDDYWTRSQVFRVLQFSSALVGGVAERCGAVACSNRLLAISYCIAGTRVTLRLLDDLPALLHTVNTLCKSKQGVRWVSMLEVVCGQLYYPVEHLAWAADNQVLPLTSSHLWTVAILLWIIPLLTSLLRLLLKLKSNSVTTPTQRRRHVLEVVRCLFDICLAVHWLPQGWLWGGRLHPSVWGLLGTVTSLVNLYQTISTKRQCHVSE